MECDVARHGNDAGFAADILEVGVGWAGEDFAAVAAQEFDAVLRGTRGGAARDGVVGNNSTIRGHSDQNCGTIKERERAVLERTRASEFIINFFFYGIYRSFLNLEPLIFIYLSDILFIYLFRIIFLLV